MTVRWDRPLEPAQKFPLTEPLFREQFGRLGDTPFELVEGNRRLESPSGAMVPKSVLNDLRRQAVQRLTELREDRNRFAAGDPDALDHVRAEIVERYSPPKNPPGPPLQRRHPPRRLPPSRASTS